MEIFKLNSKNFQKAVNKGVKFIKKGKIIVSLTDTVYGILADYKNKEVLERIFKIKKRTSSKPFAIFVKDIEMAKKFAKITKNEEEFLKRVWFTRSNFQNYSKENLAKIAPKIWTGKGKVTVILKTKEKLPYISFKNTIGIRIPNSEFILSLIEKIKKPLVQTSANISGKSATTKIKEVIDYFKNQKSQPDLIFDAGDLKAARPSLVVDLTKRPPKILRK